VRVPVGAAQLQPPGAQSRPVGSPTSLRRVRARLDRVVDALSRVDPPGLEAAQRKLASPLGPDRPRGLRPAVDHGPGGAGTAMYLFAYGLLLLVVEAYLIAPHRLRAHRGRGTGCSPGQGGRPARRRGQAHRHPRVGAFILEDGVPERLGAPVRVRS